MEATMRFRIGDRALSIPIVRVERLVSRERARVVTGRGGELLEVDGLWLPLVRLGALLRRADDAPGVFVIYAANDERIALEVDAWLGVTTEPVRSPSAGAVAELLALAAQIRARRRDLPPCRAARPESAPEA